jgi:NitT/TauT family transport system substrate-binding protein
MLLKILQTGLKTAILVALGLLAAALPAHGTGKSSFKVAWSIYVGWMPWDYARQSGILKKWADKYGIEIELIRVGDYVQSVERFTAGKYDACAMTNMDMLTLPAAAGMDSTAVIVGDFSNGNDGIVLKGRDKKLADIKGLSVNLTEGSVSHYLLARSLDSIGLTEQDVRLVNTSDALILAAFAKPTGMAAVTWKPRLANMLELPNTSLVFDSSRIPGEIIDMMVVDTAVLRTNPKLGRALAGAWYETLGLMSGTDAKAIAVLSAMANATGTDLTSFRRQLTTTKMFAVPAEAHGFMNGASLVRTMDLVRSFSFSRGLLGKHAKTVDAVGIEFPRGTTLGDAKNIKMRFDAGYTQLAMEGKL